ncbi:TetR/AcrR family transcriptional regulator [Trichlorobacter lovleyi]|jgi:Transcriptional regulator|nr:TetR/AcrR family transcriptional regulator [Trichlorobacter lovleyi]
MIESRGQQMARAQFDREEIIDKSIGLFWENGYSASSMQKVVKTTGLKPGSIYLAFGNKEGLFREALESYARKTIEAIHHLMATAPSISAGICMFLEQKVVESTQKTYCSCFLVKTRLELAAEGGELHELASSKLDKIEEVLEGYIDKEYGSEVSKQRAISLMMHIFGVRVYGYQQGSADRMRLGLKEGLPWLPWETLN